MRKFVESVKNFLQKEDGPTAVEYAVMLALIIVVCITAITALGTNANKTFAARRMLRQSTKSSIKTQTYKSENAERHPPDLAFVILRPRFVCDLGLEIGIFSGDSPCNCLNSLTGRSGWCARA
jgi:pilus assembly protein Flp/PilA